MSGTSTPEPTVPVLETAREIVASEQWTTGLLCDPNGKVCALGAIGRALGWSDERLREGDDDVTYDVLDVHPAALALCGALPQEYKGDNFWAVVNFNDGGTVISQGDYGAHQKKVVALFDRAIADERARIQEQEAGAPLPPLTVAHEAAAL